MKMGAQESHSYPYDPRNVRMDSTARKKLADEVQEAINEAFLFANHSETLSTIKPLELVPIDYDMIYSSATGAIAFDRAFLESTFDRSIEGTTLRSSTVRLRHTTAKPLQADLFLKAGDDIPEYEKEYINPEQPYFYIDAPVDGRSTKRERMNLTYSMSRNIMNHLVQLAHPIASLTIPNRDLSDSVTTLFSQSEITSISRSTKYLFRPNEDEQLIVTINDRGTIEPHKEPIHTLHEVNVQKMRSFGRAGTLATSLHFAVSKHDISASIGKEFTYNDGAAADIADRTADVAEAFRELSADTPQEFGRQILDSIHLLSSVTANAGEIEQLEY